MSVERFLMMERLPKTMSQTGTIFCRAQFFKLIDPMTIMAIGTTIKMARITIMVMEQQKTAAMRFMRP